MDFFGFGAAADLSTPIGVMIKSGTDSLLIGPDWSKNLEICEEIMATKDGPDQALKAITRRLQDSDLNTVYLALIILETCWKNCGQPFMKFFDRGTMDEVVAVGRGSKGDKNAFEALRLIQEWGREYEHQRSSFPLFFETYMNLKSKGMKFPQESARPTSTANNSNSNNTRKQQSKVQEPAAVADDGEQDGGNQLENDLSVVMEKVRLCREMLLVSPGIRQDELLADVVGFLEACQERMSELIEAGTQGLLSEEQFESCLKVNDAVIKTLDAEKNGVQITLEDESLKTTKGKGGEGKSPETSTGNLLDLDPSPVPAKPKAVDLLSATENDFFNTLETKPAMSTSAKKPVAKSSVLTSVPTPPSNNHTKQTDQSAVDAAAFDPFSIQQQPPAAPAATTSAATMSDVDFDAFFNDLGVNNNKK